MELDIDMQKPLQITFRDMEPSEAVEQRIRAKAAELERFHDRIISCHVTVHAPHGHHLKGNLYSVCVDLHLPDKDIVVGRERPEDHAHEDVYVAVRDAFDAAVRRLEDDARRKRHRVKRHQIPAVGRVTKLFPNAGYGFLEMPDGLEVYFHQNSVNGDGFRSLGIGHEVRVVLAEGEGEKGPQASAVTPVFTVPGS
jgi:ribosomal subunit interface protein